MSDSRELTELRRAWQSGRLDRREFIRRALAAGVGLTALPAFLAACAGAPASPTAAPKPPAAPTTAPSGAAPTAAPKPAATSGAAAPAATAAPAKAAVNAKDTLNIGYSIDAEHYHPTRIRSTATAAMTGLIYQQMVTRDPTTMKIIPMLAASWKTVDPTTWEFKLRQGVKYHNGDDFNAECVKFSYDRIIENSANNSGFVYIGGVYKSSEIVDPYTIRIKTEYPDPIFTSRLAAEPVTIISPKWAAAVDEKDWPTKPNGTGPYKLSQYVLGDKSVLERNDAYWGDKAPTKTLVFKTIPDPRTRLAALQRGEVDLINNLTVEMIPTVEKEASLAVFKSLGSFNHKLIFNISKDGQKEFQDVKVRQALNYAVDRQALIKGLFNGTAEEYDSVIVKQLADYVAQPPYAYSVDKAKALLTEAGLPNGFETELWVPTARYPQAEQAVQAISDMWSKVGVKAKIVTAEWATYNQKAGSDGMKTVFYYPHSIVLWEPDQIFGYFDGEKKRWNYYLPPESTQKLIRDAAGEFDPQKRHEELAQIQKLLWADAPFVTLYQIPELYGNSKKVKGFVVSGDQTPHFEHTYIEA